MSLIRSGDGTFPDIAFAFALIFLCLISYVLNPVLVGFIIILGVLFMLKFLV